MFELIAIVVLTATLYLLTPKPQIEKQKAADLNGYQAPRSKEGDPVAFVYGTVKIASPNTEYFGNGSVVTNNDKNQYHFTLDLSLCLGPNARLRSLWYGKDKVWSGDITSFAPTNPSSEDPSFFVDKQKELGVIASLRYFSGENNQTFGDGYVGRWGRPVDDYPDLVGKAHLFGRWILDSPYPSDIAVEVTRTTDVLNPGYGISPDGYDMNPVEILYDIFTRQKAMLGMDPSRLDLTNWRLVAQQLYNEGIFMSMKLEKSVKARDVVNEILKTIDGTLTQSGGKTKIILFRNDYVVGNLPLLTETQVQRLVSSTKSTWEQTYNQVRVTYSGRDTDYSDRVACAQDFGNLSQQGKVRSQDLSFPCCTTADIANTLAKRTLRHNSVPLFSLEIVCNHTVDGLWPGSLFRLRLDSVKIPEVVCRVQKIDWGTLKDSSITITAIQDYFAATGAFAASPPPPLWSHSPYASDPMPVQNRVIMEAPWFMGRTNKGQGSLILAARMPSANSLHFMPTFNVWNKEDGTTSHNPDILTSDESAHVYAPSGQLVSSLSSTLGESSNWYDANAEIVITNIRERRAGQDTNDCFSDYALAHQGEPDFSRDGSHLILIGDEIMSFDRIDLSGYPNVRITENNMLAFDTTVDTNSQIKLKGIRRNILDSMPVLHAANEYVYFLHVVNGKTNHIETINKRTPFKDTAEIYVSLADETVTGTLPVSDLLTDTVQMKQRAQRPFCPTLFKGDGTHSIIKSLSETPGTITFTWVARDNEATSIMWYGERLNYTVRGLWYKISGLVGSTWKEITTTKEDALTFKWTYGPWITQNGSPTKVKIEAQNYEGITSWSYDWVNTTFTS
jgi:hypothetical protein